MRFAAFGQFIGAALVTFLISRLFLYLTKKWNGGVLRLIIANVASLALCAVLSAFGSANGGELNWVNTPVYAFAQAAWLAFDVFRHLSPKEAS